MSKSLQHKGKKAQTHYTFIGEKGRFMTDLSHFIVGSLIGAIFFFGIYGYSRVIPWNDGWLMAGGDLSQHYLGWRAYRASPWTFPFCLTDRLSYPVTTSIMFTDSIPLLAVFFKILSPILPNTFQYFGLFGFFTYVLQGGFGALLLRKLKCSTFVSLMGSAIISFMPTIMQRMFDHTSLASQWTILAALCLFFSGSAHSKQMYKKIMLWCLLAFITTGLHLYLTVMMLVILFGYCFSLLLIIGPAKLKTVVATFLFPLLTALFSIFIFGGFVGKNTLSGSLPDRFTSDVMALFNSDGWSRFGWRGFTFAYDGQYEGFAYLGIGVIGLVFLFLFTFVFSAAPRLVVKLKAKRSNAKTFNLRKFIIEHPKTFSIIIVIFISLLLGWGSTISLSEKTIFIYPIPEKLLGIWGIFRATGRFTWIAVYSITALVIAFTARRYKRAGKYLIIVALVLQFMDLQPFSRSSHSTTEYITPLRSLVWSQLSGYKHVYFQPDIYTEVNRAYVVTKYAFDKNMTINKGYFARPLKDTTYPPTPSSDTLYFFNSEWEAMNMPLAYEIDGNVVSATADTVGNLHQIMATHPEFLLDGIVQIRPQTKDMVIRNAELSENGDLLTNGFDDLVLFGPYWDVKSGLFDFTLNYEVVENVNSAETVGVFDVCTSCGANVIKSVDMPANNTSVAIKGISFPDLADTFENRVHNRNGAKLRIISVDIRRSR